MIKDSMLSVTEQTINNCFIKAGFKTMVICDVVPDDAEDGETIWQELIEKIGLKYSTFKDYVSQDDDVPTTETLNDDDIVQSIVEKETESDEEEVTIESNVEVVTDAEALKCIKDLKIFFQRKEDIFDDVLHEMVRVVAFNLFTKKRQMTYYQLTF